MERSENEGGARDVVSRAAVRFEDAETSARKLDIQPVDWPGVLFFWALAVIVFLQFFTRYVLNDSLAWTEEIARYMLILVAFAGAVTVTRKGTAIFLEFFYRYIPARAGKWLSVCIEVVTAGFYGYLVLLGVELSLKTRTKMASAEIPKSLVYWSVTACLVLMTLFSVIWVIRKARQKPEDVIRAIEEQAVTD